MAYGFGLFLRCLLFSLLLLPAGCGYRVHAVVPAASAEGSRSFAINVFSNRTYRANIESFLSNSVVDEFGSRHGIVLAEPEYAGFILQGAILSYAATAVSYSATDTVKEYRADMVVEASLVERATGKLVWKGTVTGSEYYPVIDNIALQQNSESAAIQAVSRKIAQEIYLRIDGNF